MALYTPRVAIDAIPPNNYPPKFVAARLLPRLGATVLGLATVLAAKASIFDPLPSRPPNHCVTPFQLTPLESSLTLGSRLGRFHASVVVELLVMATFGYLYVSGVALQRPAWFGSRYGSCREFVKLVCAMPFLYVLAPMHSLACPVDCIGAAGFPMSAGSAFGGLRLGSHLPVELVAAFFLGIHYIYLDNSPLLQSFGCKWPVPSRWKTMTVGESILAVCILVGAGSFIVHHVRLLVLSGSGLQVLLLYGAGLSFMVIMTAVVLRGTHNVHFHHYCAGVTMLPVTRFCSPLSWLSQGVFLAMFVEGVACWGMDPIWVRSQGASNTNLSAGLWTEMVTLVGSPLSLQRLLVNLAAIFRAVETSATLRLPADGSELMPQSLFASLQRCGRLERDIGELRQGKGTNAASEPCEAARSLAARLHDSLVDDPVLLLAVVDTLYKALAEGGGDMHRIVAASSWHCSPPPNTCFEFSVAEHTDDGDGSSSAASSPWQAVQRSCHQVVARAEAIMDDDTCSRLEAEKAAICSAMHQVLESCLSE